MIFLYCSDTRVRSLKKGKIVVRGAGVAHFIILIIWDPSLVYASGLAFIIFYVLCFKIKNEMQRIFCRVYQDLISVVV